MPQSMPFVFSIDLPGQDRLVRGLQRFAQDIDDWTRFWNEFFRDAWYRHLITNYETEGSSTGNQWAPLSLAYQLWKDKHFPGMPIGVRSGVLKSSLTTPGAAGGVWQPGAKGLTVGTSVGYGMLMQMGTGRRGKASGQRKYRGYAHGSGGGMPARPPLRTNDEFMNLMGRLLQEYAVKSLRGQLS